MVTLIAGEFAQSKNSKPVSPEKPRKSSEIFALGLMMMYIKDLAQNKTAPPQNLLIGKNSINLSALAKVLHKFSDLRTDLKSLMALHTSGANWETLRKPLGQAKQYFSDSIVDE